MKVSSSPGTTTHLVLGVPMHSPVGPGCSFCRSKALAGSTTTLPPTGHGEPWKEWCQASPRYRGAQPDLPETQGDTAKLPRGTRGHSQVSESQYTLSSLAMLGLLYEQLLPLDGSLGTVH